MSSNRSINMASGFDPHIQPHQGVTFPQLTLAFAALIAFAIWLQRLPNRILTKSPAEESVTDDGATSPAHKVVNMEEKSGNVARQNGADGDSVKKFTQVRPPTTLDEFLQGVVEFTLIMLMFYVSDYKKLLPAGERIYARDTFLFLIFLLFLVAASFTTRSTPDIILNRDQTEEWKGWMQVMFVWYHYFHALEWYNWIRVYIAAYVWMTGFGNFSFFWIKKDYSLWRVAKMLFRLNFLVLMLCALLANEYILYYICAMHTYWFISVYALMAIYPSCNYVPRYMLLKFLLYAAANFVIFDISGMAEVVFLPLWLVLGYHDGTYPIMHEWSFRAGLDHWACFIGMVCAYNYPHFESFLKYLEAKSTPRRTEYATKGLLAGVMLLVLFLWHQEILAFDKYTYNHVHPYTSWIPIVSFIVLRNLLPVLRTHYLFMFNWLGKITLETYLSQLHIYLQSNAKELIVYIPGYPLLNFAFSTIVYLLVSHRIFTLTVMFSAFLLPHDRGLMQRNMLGVAVAVVVSVGAATFFKLV